MAVTLKVYDVTNTTLLGTLSQAHGIGWLSDIRVPGSMTITVDHAATADRALLEPLRVIRVNDGTQDIEAFVIRDEPAELVVTDERPRSSYRCNQLLSWLGYGTGGATLWPYGGLDGKQQNPRWFGPMGFDFIERTGIPEPDTGGALTRENWQDPRSEALEYDTRAVFRRYLTGDGGAVRPARMWTTSTAWSEIRVFWDGAELPELSQPIGDRTIRMLDLPFDGEDHIICFDCTGDTPPAGQRHRIGWTYAVLEADDVGEYNDWGTMENRLFTTFNSMTYSGPTAPTEPYWQAWEDYADGAYPGVNVGYVALKGVTEAKARGLLPSVTADFDEETDSEGVDWEHEFARAFRCGEKLGHLLDALSAWKCEPEMTPANVLRIHQQRGTDRTATVTITSPFSLSATGRGPRATRYLIETEGGFGTATDSAAETALGVALEDYLQLGEDIHPHTVAEAIALQLAEDSGVRNDLEVELPDSLTPYVDIFLGDTVQCQSDADGTISDVRITSLRGEVRDDTGRVEWFATLEPA
jgi:hypothetical protein